MTDFYTNLPPKNKDNLENTINTLVTSNYEEDYQFNAGEYDAVIGFFVKRGFSRTSAESTAYVIMAQAKIDNVKPTEILDKLGFEDCKLIMNLPHSPRYIINDYNSSNPFPTALSINVSRNDDNFWKNL